MGVEMRHAPKVSAGTSRAAAKWEGVVKPSARNGNNEAKGMYSVKGMSRFLSYPLRMAPSGPINRAELDASRRPVSLRTNAAPNSKGTDRSARMRSPEIGSGPRRPGG